MDEKRICDGHCEKCNINQRSYCSAQMAYYNQKEIAEIKAMLKDKNNQEIQTSIGINTSSEIEEA